MIKVRVIKKFYDKDYILLGYTIQDTTGQQMNVNKESLKNAVKNGECDVVNMTLTSDGRLIGKAAPTPKKRNDAQKKTAISFSVLTIYNVGKTILAVELLDKQSGRIVHDFGKSAEEVLNNENITIDNNTKKKPFKSVYEKAYNSIQDTLKDKKIGIKVEKQQKDTYLISWDKSEIYNNDMLSSNIHMCIAYCILAGKMKVLGHYTYGVEVKSFTGINDVRKALKAGKIDKL